MVTGNGGTRRFPHLSWWQVALAAVGLLAGFVFTLQIRTGQAIQSHLHIASTQLEELGYMLREQERTRAALEEQIVRLRVQLRDYEQAASQGKSALEAMNRQLQELRVQAGLAALEGPGVLVELKDSPRPLRAGEDPNLVILHYTDLWAVINDLWAAGAEAVAINEERVIVTTGLSCVGTTILCNAKRIAPPYRIAAIGDGPRLDAHLRRPGGIVDQLTRFGFPVRITAVARVQVPAYKGSLQMVHAVVPR
ncbi:MAG: DUF881 domain-containing protein [Armatimonadetes bacterium]|nr:DUF881 domain-containing protein [Armatimonadota bacterium]